MDVIEMGPQNGKFHRENQKIKDYLPQTLPFGSLT
jgi:hypothetical protein